MRFNFKKIASVLASAVMLGSTVGIAAAANYPAPFIAGGGADVAVVVGANAASTDFLAAVDLGQNLQAELAKQTSGTTTTTGSVSGEAAAVFTSASKLWVNDSFNSVKSVITETEMPTILADGDFNGNVDATYTQTITLGNNPKTTFQKQPTSSDDPLFALQTSSTSGNDIYNATLTFNKAVNFTHADSKNQELTMFGMKFTVGSATTNTNLILLKSAETVSLSSDSNPSQEVTIAGKKYTLELVSASDTAATIKVTNEAGTSEQKEVTEGFSKKINGLTVAVNTADETNFKLSASVAAGADKVTFANGQSVTYGETDAEYEGTKVTFTQTTGTGDLSAIKVSVRAPNDDSDALKPGETFVDPVFGTFRLDFSGLNIAEDSTTGREELVVKPSGDNKLTLDMTDYRGDTKTGLVWAINQTVGGLFMQIDDTGRNLVVAEREAANLSSYVVVGNEDEAYLLKVQTITNLTDTGYSTDKVAFTNVFDSEESPIETTLTQDGSGTVTIGGRVYNVNYYGTKDSSSNSRFVRLDYPDSATGELVVYPTIQTGKGAKVAFYEPLNISLATGQVADGLAGITGATNAAKTIKIPDGDGYTSIVATLTDGFAGNWSIAYDGVFSQGINATAANTASSASGNIGKLKFNMTGSGAVNQTTLYLINPATNLNILTPALIIFEEKDDNVAYEALIVTPEEGGNSEDGIGVGDVIRTWMPVVSTGSTTFRETLSSNSKLTKEADLWGTVVTLDDTDSDQRKATLSYPDEQVYAQIYFAATDAVITPGSTGSGSVTELGSVTVKDSEVSSVSSKNLLVVGGSCINTVAAKVLGSDVALCGAAFTEKAGVGENQALLKVVTSPYSTTKVAMLVAGYEAADTTKAVKYLTTSKPSTDKDVSVKLSTVGSTATVVTA